MLRRLIVIIDSGKRQEVQGGKIIYFSLKNFGTV